VRGPEAGGDEVDLDLAPPEAAGDQPERPSDERGHRRRRRLVVAAAAVVVLLAVGAGVGAQRRAADRGPAPLDGSASAEELFPVLARPARAGTALPDDGLAEDVGVRRGSERLLAVAPAASYWVARSPSGGVCLVVRATVDVLGRSGVCTSAAAAARGVTVPAGGGPGGTLLPAGASTRDVEAAGDAELVDGLWVDAATAAGVVEAAVAGASSRLPAVQLTVRRGSGWLPVLLTAPGRPYAVVLACLRAEPVRLSLDGEDAVAQACPEGVLVRQFTGDGQPVQVGLEAPEHLVWAAEVVTCTGGPAGASIC
jgi:hypothetical protein